MSRIEIIGAATAFGQPKLGVDLGPDAVRYAGLVGTLESLGNDIKDSGNVRTVEVIDVDKHSKDKEDNLRNFNEVKEYSIALAEKVDKAIQDKRIPLVIGGDHSLSIGSISGVTKHYDNLGVIWYDAHGDLNDSKTSPSGNIHGMPLSSLLGEGHDALVNIYHDGAKLKKENIVLIGVRDLDEGEKTYINEHNIKVYTATDVSRKGIETVISEALDYLEEKVDGIHVSLDVDALDPIYTPGTGTPVSGGVSLLDTQIAMEMISNSKKLVSMDLVEVNPLLDDNNRTAELAVEIAASMFGKKQL